MLTGPLEPTNEWYAIAKIAGIKLCQAYRQQYGRDFISAMPTNLYGPNDNFDLTCSHVLPALIRKFHDAKVSGAGSVEIWGTGSPMREFLHVDDLADACVHLMEHYSDHSHINVGTGVDLSIRELAEKVRDLVYPQAELRFDTSKPDGTPRKVLDITRLRTPGGPHRSGSMMASPPPTNGSSTNTTNTTTSAEWPRRRPAEVESSELHEEHLKNRSNWRLCDLFARRHSTLCGS